MLKERKNLRREKSENAKNCGNCGSHNASCKESGKMRISVGGKGRKNGVKLFGKGA